MDRAVKTLFGTAIAFASTAAAIGLAIAQVPPRPGEPGNPQTTIPEKMLPPSEGIPARKSDSPATNPATGAARNETLTDKLDRTDGVLTPPANVSPPMTVPAPAPKIDQDMVVPPPAPQQAPPQPK